jgi:hypothetical protein
LRNYDPLLARFSSIDHYEQYWSPYLAMGNNHPNMIDPDGGDAYTAMVGGVIGAGLGLIVAGAIDLADGKGTSDAKRRDTYALCIGSGIVAGAAIAGFGWDKVGSTFKGVFEGWRTNIHGKLGYGMDGHWWSWKKGVFGLKHGFSSGFRIGNLVIWDIYLGTPRWQKPWDNEFPGRGLSPSKTKNRVQFFYTVKAKNALHGHPKDPNFYVHPLQFGFRWLFNECFWLDYSNSVRHKPKRTKR